MTPLKFTCKKTKNVYTEVFGKGWRCDLCAFRIDAEYGLDFFNSPTQVLIASHCMAMPCSTHKSYFVKVESDAKNV